MKDTLNSIITHYGVKAQVLQCIEEMAELTKELLKNVNRDKFNVDEIISEVADVELTLKQIKLIYKIDQEIINDIISKKLDIVLKRIEAKNERA